MNLLDSHCHLDRYGSAQGVAAEAARRGVFTIAVTNLPSHFKSGLAHVRQMPGVRLALGLHPLAAGDHARELAAFDAHFSATSFIGEVGLDFSRERRGSERQQMMSFRHVVSRLAATMKVVSLHSRGAESEVVAVLKEHGVTGCIFHWYTGSLGTLEDVIQAGHFLSVNPAMTRSAKGREIIRRIPRQQVLTETDGPHVQVEGAPAKPWHVVLVEDYLAELWDLPRDQVRAQVWSTFIKIVKRTESTAPLGVCR